MGPNLNRLGLAMGPNLNRLGLAMGPNLNRLGLAMGWLQSTAWCGALACCMGRGTTLRCASEAAIQG